MARVLRALAGLPFVASVACSSGGGSSAGAPSAPGGLEALGGAGAGTCVPEAPHTFAQAVCVCGDMAEGGVIKTSAPAGAAANVEVDGRVAAGTGASIAGELTAYQGLAVAGALDVRDSVLSTQNVSGAGVLNIGGDFDVGGQLLFTGALSVNGALRVATPSVVLVPVHVGSTAAYASPAGPPCACAPESLLPIAKIVAYLASSNDDAAHGLSEDGAALLGAGVLTLSPGKYYFRDVSRIGLGKIAVEGAVTLAFDGSLTSLGVGQLELSPGASLDVYVNGALGTAGAVSLGDPTRPEAFRLFVGGAGAVVATAGAQQWNGLVYAPQADVRFAGITAVNGSIFAKTLAWDGVLDVAYPGWTSTPGASCSASQPDPLR